MTNTPDFIVSVGTGKGEDEKLVHVPEHRRGSAGRKIAAIIDETMRSEAWMAEQNYQGNLCPGCYMAVTVNTLLELARRNGQTIQYIRDHMNRALNDLAAYGITEADAKAKGMSWPPLSWQVVGGLDDHLVDPYMDDTEGRSGDQSDLDEVKKSPCSESWRVDCPCDDPEYR